MRRSVLLLLVLCLLAPGSALAGEEAERAAFVQESRAMVKTFAGSLKGELQAAIKKGGAVEGISVCNARAPEIAAELSSPGQWTVGRTSHKLRNPENRPDDWEKMVLAEFLDRAKAGESLKTMEKVEVFSTYGSRIYRYMKAIPAGEVCLTCHGADIDPELQAAIARHYPADKATGFALGDLRGAFTLSKTAAN